MKKIFIILLLIIFTIGCSKKTKTIEEILNIKLENISYIKTGGFDNINEYYNVNDFIEKYQNNKYKKISGEYGSTTHIYYVCYDTDDNIIFTLVDIGNQDKVFIKKGTFDINEGRKYLYQLDS